jgi:lysine 6-dehydrogenase
VRYLVLGAGAQGRAAAYDLARSPDTRHVVLTDAADTALVGARDLLRRTLPDDAFARLTFRSLDVTDTHAVGILALEADVVASCVPYFLNLPLAKAALAARASFLDLGGNTAIVHQELALDAEARAAGVALVPDCGLGPGMISTAAVHAMHVVEGGFDEIDEVKIYDCGLPQNRNLPFGYRLLFSVEGLINEYIQPATAISDGRRVEVAALSEQETLDLPEPLGRCEAAHAAGGLSTMAWTYEGKVRTLFNKLIRYPGHLEAMRALGGLGFFSDAPVDLQGRPARPRDLAARLLERAFDRPEEPDLVFIRVVVTGTRDGRRRETTGEMLDRFDPATGMTAMMRTTGFPAAIVAQMIAGKEIAPGARPVELAVPSQRFLDEAARRGLEFRWTVRETPA